MSKSPADFFKRAFSAYEGSGSGKEAGGDGNSSSNNTSSSLSTPPFSLGAGRSGSINTLPGSSSLTTTNNNMATMAPFLGSEKSQKKIRILVDSQQKTKHRLAALQTILQSTPEHEQVRLFKEYASQIIGLAVEIYNGFLEKMAGRGIFLPFHF